MEDDSNKSGKYPPVVDGAKKAAMLTAVGVVLVAVGTFLLARVVLRTGGMVAGGVVLLGGAFAFAAVIHLWRK